MRRLASEGLRPRLPWASKLQRFIDDPVPLIPVLTRLKDDPVRYVHRSVANCLGDLLKDNPQMARPLMESWLFDNPTSECRWVIRHGVRNLRKKGDDWAVGITEQINHGSF